jgi:hypothetical protein
MTHTSWIGQHSPTVLAPPLSPSPSPPHPHQHYSIWGERRGGKGTYTEYGGSSKEHRESCLKLEGVGGGGGRVDPLVLNGRSVGTRSRYGIEK